jgi:hypothetical protein
MTWGKVIREISPNIFDGFTGEMSLVGRGSLVIKTGENQEAQRRAAANFRPDVWSPGLQRFVAGPKDVSHTRSGDIAAKPGRLYSSVEFAMKKSKEKNERSK